MYKYFPVDSPLLPHDPPLTGLFNRLDEFNALLKYLDQDGRAAIWAPRYSGRTTFLYTIEDRLRRMEELAVYVSPEEHLDLTNRGTLFRSLGSHISSQLSLTVDKIAEAAEVYEWDKPDSLIHFLKTILVIMAPIRLTIILDDCDKLLSASLVTLLRFMRSVDQLRSKERLWRRIAFVVAGAVSFRNLKLLESNELSPFEKWRSCRLRDLTTGEAAQYLSEAFMAVNMSIEHEAVEAVISYAGGDLRALNRFGQELYEHYLGSGTAIGLENVKKVAKDLLANYAVDSSIAYMLSVITHDPRCLRVVDRLLSDPEKTDTYFVPEDLYLDQKQRFEMSNQELSGGFALDESNLSSIRWVVRNRLRGEIMHKHFTTRRLARALLDIGQYQRAETIIKNRLASELEKDFREDVLSFDETAVRDVIEWFWSYGAHEPTFHPKMDDGSSFDRGVQRTGELVDRVLAGFEALAFVVERIFGIETFALYELDTGTNSLVANDFVPGRASDLRSISLDKVRNTPTPEARAYLAKVYTIEIEEHARLKIAIPLKNLSGNVTGILSFRTDRYLKEDWATLFVRVPIIERVVNSIWRLLSRYERDQYKGLAGATTLISVQFGTISYKYFQKNMARFPVDLPAQFLEFKKGIIFNEIIRAMRSPRSLMIFDLSQINDNVLFELGIAIGLNRPGLPVRDRGRELNLVPLEGLVREMYQPGRILGEAFFDQLRDRWTSYQAQVEDEHFVHLLNEEVLPYSGEAGAQFLLVIDHNRYRDSGEYRKAVERAAKRTGIQRVIYLWQGGTKDDRFSQEARAEDTTLLLSIYKLIQRAQAVVARIEKVQDEDRYALRFLATGIAMGLAKKQRRENLVLTARSASKEGRTISLPGDFSGCEPIHFDAEHIQNFVDDLACDIQKILAAQ